MQGLNYSRPRTDALAGRHNSVLSTKLGKQHGYLSVHTHMMKFRTENFHSPFVLTSLSWIIPAARSTGGF